MTDMNTIMITGSTDGIGLATARTLVAEGHKVLIHGRSATKLESVQAELGEKVETHRADLSDLDAVRAMAGVIREHHGHLDVLINNAGVYNVPAERTPSGLDMRFAVNTIAPYVLTRALLPIIPSGGRVVNLSSAAQAPVDLKALRGGISLSAGAAYAQSKLALTMWTNAVADELSSGPVVVSVNPGSLLATNMVRDAFNTAGQDIGIGVDILVRSATSSEFADATGRYFDNDAGRFAQPHHDATDLAKCRAVVQTIEDVLA